MSDIHDRQKSQDDMQKSDAVLDAFSKIVSGGRAGYKTVIEKKPEYFFCRSCNLQVDKSQKFCHECGAKNDDPIQR